MKKLLLFLTALLLVTSFIGCKKEEVDCQKSGKATIIIYNTQSGPYDVTIDGVPNGSIPGYNYKEFTVMAGCHNLYFTQKFGDPSFPVNYFRTSCPLACKTEPVKF